MAKITISITVDPELLEKAKDMRINMSGAFNDFLRILLAQQEGDTSKIDYELERQKLENLKKKHSRLASEIKETQFKMERYETYIEQEKEAKLLKEREILESKQKCDECKQIKNPKLLKQFPKAKICTGCYQDRATGEKLKEWGVF